MKTSVSSKLLSVMVVGFMAVLFTANTAQARNPCCCCTAPLTCVPYEPGFPPTCPSNCGEVSICYPPIPGGSCADWCVIHMDRPDEEETIESFMSDEYVDEVIAMDEECLDEVDETVDAATDE